jgi:putative hydrolase of the HAD superfamily
MNASLRAVTFDVGGTLIEPWPSVGHVYAKVAGEHGFANLGPEILNRRFAAAWQAKKDFDHSQAAWRQVVDATFANMVTGTKAFFPELYERFGQASAWRIFDDVAPCLERLKRCGLKLGIISNWDERLRPLLHELRLTPFFDAITISYEHSCRKPSIQIFERAAELLALPTSAMLHVGDNAEEDFGGARTAGMHALLLNRRGRRNQSEITSLQDVLLGSNAL